MRDDAAGEAERGTGVMTIGALSRRTGVAVKTLRAYEDAGLIYTAGRSPGNYRLFTGEAVTCVKVIEILRSLGLTLAELEEFAAGYLTRPDELAGPLLARLLTAARARTDERIAELRRRRRALDAYQSRYAAELAGEADIRRWDPRA